MYAQHELQEIQLQFHQTAVENSSNDLQNLLNEPGSESDFLKGLGIPVNSKNISDLDGLNHYIVEQQLEHFMAAPVTESPVTETNLLNRAHSDTLNPEKSISAGQLYPLGSLDPLHKQSLQYPTSEAHAVATNKDSYEYSPELNLSYPFPVIESTDKTESSIIDLHRKFAPLLGSPLALEPPIVMSTSRLLDEKDEYEAVDKLKDIIPDSFDSSNSQTFETLQIDYDNIEHSHLQQLGERNPSLSDFYLKSNSFRISSAIRDATDNSAPAHFETNVDYPGLNIDQLHLTDQPIAQIARMPGSIPVQPIIPGEAPSIDHVAQMNEVTYIDDGYSPDATPIRTLPMDTPLNNSSSRLFALTTPLVAERLEPSPQLPSPLFTKPLRLSLAQGKEFALMRKMIATEMKNPAEYSLHISFTQFVRQAEGKLKRFMEYPLDREPPILELLAEGVDPRFDNMIASLGYIAKRKPKPVIDSVMYWRKLKSEVATMAYAEVERIMDLARTFHSQSGILPSDATRPDLLPVVHSLELLQQTAVRGKRSLSFRRKSPTKSTHQRNASATVMPSLDRKSSAIRVNADRSLSNNDVARHDTFYDEQISKARETAIQAERKSLASIYILCRVLIEVVKQISTQVMGLDLCNKLEEIVYNQLKTTDPVATSESFVRLANWNLFAELLGYMSEKRFLNVSDRFIADLEKVPASVPYEDEPKLHLLIHGMRCLKLTNYPMEKFEESAEFVQSLTKFFCNSTSHTIVYAYTDVLSNLILPLAPKLTAEANHPLWVDAITQIYNKAYRLWQALSNNAQGSIGLSHSAPSAHGSEENSDWDTLITLMTSAIAVSSKELFASHWFELIEANSYKLKTKCDTASKTKVIVCTARLVWVYINRLPDTLNNTVKKLDRLFDILFFGPNVVGKKQQWVVFDKSLLDGLCEIIRIVGFQHQNYVLENVILRLLRSSFDSANSEIISSEKLIIVINSYMLCLKDRKLGIRPLFPSDEVLNSMSDYFDVHEDDKSQRLPIPRVLFQYASDSTFIKQNKAMSEPRGLENYENHEEIFRNLTVLLKLLDSQCGVVNWTKNENSLVNLSMPKSFSSISSFNFSLDFSQNQRSSLIELFVSLLDASAWSIAPVFGDKSNSFKTSRLELPYQALVEILIRNSIHENQFVASAALRSLTKLASQRNAGNLITIFARIGFRLTEKPGQTYDSDYFNSKSFLRLLRIYVELLRCWLHQFSEATSNSSEVSDKNNMMGDETINDLYQINFKAPDLTNLDIPANKLKPYEELEWKNVITVIEAVEGNGLFFLCSGDSRVRQCAVAILKIVEQFDQSIYDSTDMKSPDSNESKNVLSSPTVNAAKGHSRTSSKYAAEEGTRLIQVIDNIDLLDLLKPLKKEISNPEKARLSKIKSKKGLLFKFASSENSIDSTIWFRIYPLLLDILFEKCPIAVALCRSIVCIRLVQMHELVVAYSESVKTYTTSLFARQTSGVPPELIINQWKQYLIFACCLLTTTNDQVISIPQQPNHGRKKSLPMYIQYQKITSAKSVFRMVLPLLKASLCAIREAVVAGLSCVNINICRTLTENLPDSMNEWQMDPKKRDAVEDLVRTEIVQILSNITMRLRNNPHLYTDEVILANLVGIIKNVKKFLTLSFVQVLPEFQRLRYFFSCLLENVYVGLKDKPDLNRWIPFEARIGCFSFLQEWCGYGDSRDILEERFNAMTKKAQLSKEPAAMIASLDYGRKSFQFAVLSCMATICSGNLVQTLTAPQKIALISFDIKLTMRWVFDILSSNITKVEEIGQTALRNILKSNINNEEIYQETLAHCFLPGSLHVRQIYFTLLVEFFKQRLSETIPYDLFCVCLFLVGSDNPEIRFSAITCIKHIEAKFYKSNTAEAISESVCTLNMVIYKKALYEIDAQFASMHPQEAVSIISYMCNYSLMVDPSTRKDIFTCLISWIQIFSLKYVNEETKTIERESENTKTLTSEQKDTDNLKMLEASSLMVLNNLIELNVKFSKDHSNEIQALWVALGTNESNFEIIFDYIINQCLKRLSAEFVIHCRQIVAYLVFSRPESSEVVDKLVNNLVPKAMVPQATQASIGDFEPNIFHYSANLNKVFSKETKESPFSLGQLSMVFLVDLFRANSALAFQNLPLLLHVSFSLLDHYLPLIREQAISLLIHLTQSIAPNNPKSQQIVKTLRSKNHHTHLWVYDDLNGEKKGGITPKNMDTTVRLILEVLTPAFPSVQQDWSHISLKWATSCAVRHIACRSFQLFRSLLTFLDQSMLKDMLHRLSNTIADNSLDIQGFAMQILMTLNAITAELSSENLIDFPQLFWASVACLSTIHEHEFIETISTMSKFVSKIDLDSPDTISCLLATFPPKWDGKFVGLQEIVMVGLRSSTAWSPTIKFLDRLTKLQDSEVIGSGDSRLFTTLITNLPRFLHSLDEKTINPEVEEVCILVSQMASTCGKAGLLKILDSLAKKKFRLKKDFLIQIVLAIKNCFFPEYEAQALMILLNFLSNKIPWVKLETLSILKLIFPIVNLQRDEFVGIGADLVAPLLRLLLTEYAEQALEVIDEAVVISGSQLDKDILRMSMGNTSMRKEYEQTATLFGIPDSSGWAIPMPAVTAARTRHNVHAVFSTCITSSTVVDEKMTESVDPEQIQFLMDDYRGPLTNDDADLTSINVEEPRASLSNMWAALDDFDSFFTKSSEQRALLNGLASSGRVKSQHAHSMSKASSMSDIVSPIDGIESVPQVYDKKALVILNQILARTQSNASFKSGLAESIGSPVAAGRNEAQSTKRSYIPFRHSRFAKQKIDNGSTPGPLNTSVFELTPSTPLRSSVPNTPNLVYLKSDSPQDTITSPESRNMETKRFELLGGRKRNRR